MKKKKIYSSIVLLGIVVSVFFFSGTIYAQCTSDFAYSIDSTYNVQFYDSSKVVDTSLFIITREWKFDDFDASSQQNPLIHFPDTGLYEVCLTIVTVDSCVDSTCKIIEITPPDCNANFSFQHEDGYTVSFFDSSSNNAHYYTWHFGDWYYSNEVNPVHNYGYPGRYKTCLLIYNADSTCMDIYCDSVIIYDTSTCHASFFYEKTNDDSTYIFTHTSTGPYTSDIWDFGDGDTASGSSVIHTFADTGIYNICLYLNNSGNASACHDTICKQIKVEDQFTISGFTYAGDQYLGDGMILLYSCMNDNYTPVDTCEVTNGFFSMKTNVGKYILYAVPETNDNIYQPTFYPESISPEDAHIINLNKNTSGIDLYLINNTAITSSNEQGFSIYPNPATQKVTIQLPDYSTHIKIVNCYGRSIYSEELNDQQKQITIKTNKLQAGLYFAILQTTNNLFTKKIIIMDF